MINTHKRRLVFAWLVICVGLSAAALAAPGFEDLNINRGNVNPNDRIDVQHVRVTGDPTRQISITSATIQNLGTAGSGHITKIEIWDGGIKLGDTVAIGGLGSGITINLGGYVIPAGTAPPHDLKVFVTIGGAVTGGETIALRVKFYYQMNTVSYSSSWIPDKSTETIRNGGFDQTSDTAVAAGFFNPLDEGQVQVATFTDNDGNGNDVTWIQTGSNRIVEVENLGTATTNDISHVQVTLRIGGADYVTTGGFVAWTPASPMVFNYDAFTPLPVQIPDNSTVTVTVEMKIGLQGAVTDGRTIQTKVTLYVTENGADYAQSVTAGNVQTIRRQGFEQITDESAAVVSGTKSPADPPLEQTVVVKDNDRNNQQVQLLRIEITNTGSADGAQLASIEVRSPTQQLLKVTNAAQLANFNTGIDIALTVQPFVADNGELTLKIYYTFQNPTDGDTVKPRVRVQGQENGTNYWSDEVTYADTIVLYAAGFEILVNVTPPEGGTAYSGQELIVMTIRVVDLDGNTDSVAVHPIVVKNLGTAQENPDVVGLKVMRRDSETDDTPLLMGETTNLAGFRTAGVTIPTQQNNVVADTNGASGSEAFLDIYATIGEPENIVVGRTLQLETRVLHTETAVGYEKTAIGNLWTLEINHRPVVDFNFAVQTAGTQALSNKAIRPKQFTYEDTLKFTSTVTDQDGAIDEPFTYLWDFDDGTTSTDPNPTHSYPNGGTFDVTLTVTDARGVSGTVTKTITVEGPPAAPPADNDPPVAAFDVNKTTSSVGEALQFTDDSTDNDGTVTGWAWEFGDGGTSAVENPTHAFMAAGAFTVSLIVTDNDGADSVQSASATITVTAPTDVVVYGYPNPASTQATFAYSLPAGTTNPVLRIFDLVGRLVRQVDLPATQTTYVWDLTADVGGAVANGLYFCVITAQNAAGAAIKSQIFKLLIDR